ncbi:hypothetical protein HUT18_23230 [Streptomyces sp. NA04227]|uniref:SCO4983 family protein n=1 Tax=Streptomyces sp. NA04227 TaxID=2742136 RepID=UPI001590B92E|nr:hypothetical protein [Streptomyces sp. NA04227]QKW08858.1 hypothetical protein HUT18_23230 [Streptomyces sp. NA04227]
MYEPIRTKSVHTMADDSDFPHRTREEELDIQLGGHLAALLAVTDELRELGDADGQLAGAAEQLAAQVARLRGGRPARADLAGRATDTERGRALHRRAHTIAGRALVVAASRADTSAAILAAERMEAHAAAMAATEVAHPAAA